MQIIAIDRSVVTSELEWGDAAVLAAACRHAVMIDMPGGDRNHMGVFASMFEAVALAGYMQGATADAERVTLETLRQKLGVLPPGATGKPSAA